ncbi:hypothetical protein GH733_015091 [Mirounga leonina]|nr:hypothetical protein GH733_015091 [Mirounga leonina]
MLPLSIKDDEYKPPKFNLFGKISGWFRSILSDKTSRNLFFFLCLNLSFAFVELLYGIWSNCSTPIWQGYVEDPGPIVCGSIKSVILDAVLALFLGFLVTFNSRFVLSEFSSCKISVANCSISSNPIIVSCGWNKLVKVWKLANCKLKTSHIGHTGYLNTVTVSPDGSLCASGDKDGQAVLWDLNEGKHLYLLDGGNIINALHFSLN